MLQLYSKLDTLKEMLDQSYCDIYVLWSCRSFIRLNKCSFLILELFSKMISIYIIMGK